MGIFPYFLFLKFVCIQKCDIFWNIIFVCCSFTELIDAFQQFFSDVFWIFCIFSCHLVLLDVYLLYISSHLILPSNSSDFFFYFFSSVFTELYSHYQNQFYNILIISESMYPLHPVPISSHSHFLPTLLALDSHSRFVQTTKLTEFLSQ